MPGAFVEDLADATTTGQTIMTWHLPMWWLRRCHPAPHSSEIRGFEHHLVANGHLERIGEAGGEDIWEGYTSVDRGIWYNASRVYPP